MVNPILQPKPEVQKTNSTPIETVFLREFVRHLIINSKRKSNIDQEILDRVRVKLGIKTEPLVPIITPIKKLEQSAQLEKSILQKKPLSRLQRRPIHPMFQQRFASSSNIQRPSQQNVRNPAQTQKKDQIQLNLGKIRPFMLDQTVTSVECPGPNKNLLVNKSGRVQATGVTMTADEIQSFLNEFSQKTKIPLISGVFKAIYDNFLVTAIISDMAGNRFIIEKHFGQPSLPKKEDV